MNRRGIFAHMEVPVDRRPQMRSPPVEHNNCPIRLCAPVSVLNLKQVNKLVQ